MQSGAGNILIAATANGKSAKNGYDVSHSIPLELRNAPMHTFGVYKTYSLKPDEHWSEYEDGLEEDWIEENKWWITRLCDNKEEMAELYRAISAEDWRHGECGGCI